MLLIIWNKQPIRKHQALVTLTAPVRRNVLLIKPERFQFKVHLGVIHIHRCVLELYNSVLYRVLWTESRHITRVGFEPTTFAMIHVLLKLKSWIQHFEYLGDWLHFESVGSSVFYFIWSNANGLNQQAKCWFNISHKKNLELLDHLFKR